MLLTWEFKTVEEAQEFLAGLVKKPAKSFGEAGAEMLVKAPVEAPIYFDPKPDFSAPISEQPAPEKKKRGLKQKAAPEKVYGIEDCRTALSALFDAKGRDAAKAALAEFKVARIGELKADQYRGFIVLCETLSQPE